MTDQPFDLVDFARELPIPLALAFGIGEGEVELVAFNAECAIFETPEHAIKLEKIEEITEAFVSSRETGKFFHVASLNWVEPYVRGEALIFAKTVADKFKEMNESS